MRYEQRVVEERRVLAIRFSQDGKEVVAELDAGRADALAREVALQAAISAANLVTFQIGTDFIVLEKKVATSVATALTIGRLKLDEMAQAERIARDSAIMLRAGSNFGLSNDPRILGVAKTLASWDSTLRRCMPGGVKSEEAFGTPALIQGPAPKPH